MYSWPDIDFAALQAHRTARVTDMMIQQDLDHILLTTFDNIRYATDFKGMIISEAFDWLAVTVGRTAEANLFVPWVDEIEEPITNGGTNIHKVHPVPSWAPSVSHPNTWADAVASTLEGARKVGYDLLYSEVLEALKSRLPRTEFVPVAPSIHHMRIIKHPSEIALLRAASQVNANAAQDAMDSASVGMRDFDVIATAMDRLQRAGVEFLSHSLCNHRRGSGTWFAQGSELREGDAYFFDIGCYGAGGYASDIARTGFVGEPPLNVRRTMRILENAYSIAQEQSKPGRQVTEIQATVNAYLTGQGVPRTPYGIGHGVGLRACELPTIHEARYIDFPDTVLQEGMVISLEPETAVQVGDDLVLLKLEDNFLVTADGVEMLSVPTG